MRETLNLATAGFNIVNCRGVAGGRGSAIGDRALLRGGGVRPEERHEAGPFMHAETVCIEYRIADAVGAGIRVAILKMDAYPFYSRGREMRPGGQELSVRGLEVIAKRGAEGNHLGGPRRVRQAGKA